MDDIADNSEEESQITSQSSGGDSYQPDSPTQDNSKTPQKRKAAGSSLSAGAKKRIADAQAAVRGDNNPIPACVVSRVDERFAVLENAHIVKSSAHDGLLQQLEWAWDQPVVNVDTRKNVHYLCIGLHRWFDKATAGWFWLPSELDVKNIIQDGMYKTYVREVEIGGTTVCGPTNARHRPEMFFPGREAFFYRLVPFPAMKDCWEIRQWPPGRMLEPFDPDLVESFRYPFQTLLPIQLHIPLHYIIINTGSKLSQVFGKRTLVGSDFGFLDSGDLRTLELIVRIYQAWMEAPREAIPGPSTPRTPPGSHGAPDPKDSQGDRDPPRRSARHTGQAQPPAAGGGGHTAGTGGHTRPLAQTDSALRCDPEPSAPAERRYGSPCHSDASSLAPSDSLSNRERLSSVTEDDTDEDKPYVDDEEEEYEDPEWLRGLKGWRKGVWSAVRRRSDSDGSQTLLALKDGDITPSKDNMEMPMAPAAVVYMQ